MGMCIFSTVNQIDAGLLKGALDEKHIECYLQNYYSNTVGLGGWTVPFAGTNLVIGNIKVIVREEDVEKANEIVKTLFGNSEEDDDIGEIEETATSENELETLNENYDTEKIIKENINNNEKVSNEKKNDPIRDFLVFTVLFLIVFSICTNIVSKTGARTQYYYYENFIIKKSEYNLISIPSEWDLNSTKDYRKRLKSHVSKLLYSTKSATEDDIFTLFINSEFTLSETKDIINDINSTGIYLLVGEYAEDENYIQIAYFEKL